MELRYPAGFRSVVDADLSLRGSLDDPTLSGSVLVKRGEMRRTLDVSAGLTELYGGAAAAAAPAATGAVGGGASFPLRFDVRLSAPSTLEMDNKLGRLTASADLRLRGTYDKPVLEGRAEVDRGEVWFEGRRYVVSRGTVDFPNPLEDRAVLRRGGRNARPRAGADLPGHAARHRHDGEVRVGAVVGPAAARGRHPVAAARATRCRPRTPNCAR